MKTDYNKFSKTFSKSRKNMKWVELEYFFSLHAQGSILDIGCGSGRLLEQYNQYFSNLPDEYLGLDMSDALVAEANKSFPKQDFRVGDMLDLSEILGSQEYKNIFLIASFHHLATLHQRESMMQSIYQHCEKGGKVYMTNWALKSGEHLEKYKHAEIAQSENIFKSTDFNIKIGKYDRFYHCFEILELSHLAEKAGFTILENRLFDNKKNIITILQK